MTPRPEGKVTRFFLVAILFITHLSLFSQQPQQPQPPKAADSLKVVQILSAQRYSYQKKDSATELLLLVGKVVLKQENTIFYADSAIYNRSARQVEAFNNVHINDNDSIHTYSDYLLYHVDTKMAELKNNVRLTDGKSNLYTNDLQYDVTEKIGIYNNGGRVVTGTSVLTSNHATYFADLKEVYFRNDVKLKDPKYSLQADSLLYNTEAEVATFVTETFIEDSARRTIRTREGFYDLKNKTASFGQRPVMQDGPVTIIANQVESDDNTGVAILTGNAIFRDTVQRVSVMSNSMTSNRNTGSLLATRKPLMILEQDGDSTIITADTLYSGRLDELTAGDSTQTVSIQKGTSGQGKDSANRFFRAYHHVRIFSDSLQAVSDSLFYSARDSVFRLYREPIVWSGNSQITGDTIYLHTKNKKPDTMYVFENGLMINKTGPEMFNQLRGNRLFGYFIDGDVNYIRAKGNAESIYYVPDEFDKIIGINKASSDIIDMRFASKQLNRIVLINEASGRMLPVRQAAEDERKIRGFIWHEGKRPKSKFELFGS